jgi:hypothetical protein
MSEATLGSIRHRMERELGRDNNAHSDGVFHCPREWMRGTAKNENQAALSTLLNNFREALKKYSW